MSTHKHIDKICCVAVVLALIITAVFMNGKSLGIVSAGKTSGYENRLFSTDRVHTVDIVMNDWDGFIETCENEEYTSCSVVIDGEKYANVGIRAKGNTSLSNVSQMDSNRYSFKLEFDQYDNTKSYYGLDKISLNNIIQDNTYMKDYLVYRMMGEFGVAAPLCSYVYITVNGEDFGLYLAVEGIEDGFLQRNYGSDYGELYKPDSMSFGGGRGNGKDFDFSEFENRYDTENGETNSENPMSAPSDGFGGRGQKSFANGETPDMSQMPEMPENFDGGDFGGRGNQGGFGGSFSVDEEKLKSALEEQGIDSSIIDGIDLNNITPETVQEVISKLDGVDIEALFKAVMDEGTFEMPGGDKGGMGGGMGSDDVKLKYIDDSFDSYSNIFDNAKTDVTDADKTRLIESLKKLSSGENVESVVDVEQVIKYFVVHNFVVNGDSYTGSMIHNYYLYEKDGVLSMLPWDYNLAFGTFQSSDATSSVNYPIDSPVSDGDISDRPMIAWIFDNEEYTNLYHEYFAQFISENFDSGKIEKEIDTVTEMISPYVEKDPTKFCDYDSFVLGASTLKKFCMLRAESVSGQLCGTISSTDSSDSDSLSSAVDASGINISDMGTMSMGGRGGNDDMPQMNQPSQPDAEPDVNDKNTAEETTQPSTEKSSQNVQTPELPEMNGEMPQDGMNSFGNGETPPEMPQGGMNSFGNGENPPEMPQGGMNPFENGGAMPSDFGRQNPVT